MAIFKGVLDGFLFRAVAQPLYPAPSAALPTPQPKTTHAEINQVHFSVCLPFILLGSGGVDRGRQPPYQRL